MWLVNCLHATNLFSDQHFFLVITFFLLKTRWWEEKKKKSIFSTSFKLNFFPSHIFRSKEKCIKKFKNSFLFYEEWVRDEWVWEVKMNLNYYWKYQLIFYNNTIDENWKFFIKIAQVHVWNWMTFLWHKSANNFNCIKYNSSF